MEKQKHILSMLLLVATCLFSTNAFAYDAEINGIRYNFNGDEAEVVGGGSVFSGDIIIPESVIYHEQTYSVTSIGERAFWGHSGLTSVTIPKSVTSIGINAFSGCTGLSSVTLNSNAIVSKGYTSTSSLGKIFGQQVNTYVIGEDVTSIGSSAFRGCSGLTSVTIPNSVTSIGSYAFYGCTGLTSVNIPNSITSIEKYAFFGCSGLTFVIIPNSVTSIGERAFYGCSGLTSVTIPNSVISIGSDAFYNCDGLKEVIVLDIAAWCSIAFDDYYSNPLNYAGHLYSDETTEITNLIIPNSVTSIGDYAFSGCNGLTSVTIPNSVTSIGDYAFSGCNGLKKVIVPDIAAWCGIAFGNEYANPLHNASRLYYNETTEITNLIIPNSVTSIGEYTFSCCSGLTSVTIPNSVTSIGSYAFNGCCFIKESFVNNSSLISDSYWGAIICELETTDGLLIHNNEIVKCRPWVTSVTIPNSVTSIGSNAFYNCSALTSVIIPNSVTSIGNSAFYNCSALTSVIIPNSVTSIGDYAFYNYSALTSVTLNSNTIVSRRYTGTYSLGDVFGQQVNSYIIGEDVTSIGSYAFYECSGLTSITIPKSVTHIGSYAFYECI